MNDLTKKAIAEAIGTFTLVFVACGVAALTGGDIVATSLAFGLTIVAMAYSVGRVSDCHINPAVSLGCLLTKRMTVKEFVVYAISQVVGGIAGAMLVFGILKMVPTGVIAGNACNTVLGYVHNGVTTGGVIAALITEIVLTCIFVYTILNVTDEKAGTGKIAGIVIGLTLTLVHLVGIKITGTSVNPARSIATAFGAWIYNGTTSAISQIWVFILAPLLGAVLAVVIYRLLNKENNQ